MPHLASVLDQVRLLPQMTDLVASTHRLGIADLAKTVMFPTPDLSRIVADLAGPTSYGQALLDSSAAVRSIVDAQQLQLGTTGASLSRMLDLQFAGPLRATLDSSLGRYGIASAALRDVSALVSDLSLFPRMTAGSAASYNLYLDRLQSSPSTGDIRFASRAGNAVAGLLTAEALWTAGKIEKAAAVGEQLYEVVVEPWVDPRSSFRADLRERLERVSGGLSDKLDYAWRIVAEDSEPVRSSVALQVTEVLNHLLRELAPIDRVSAWLHDNGRAGTKWWFENKAKSVQEPTRSAKLANAMRHRASGDTDLVVIYDVDLSRTLTATIDEGNKVKHGPSSGTKRTVQSLLIACDAIINLVLDELDP